MNDPRGSVWRKWDLHVHTPASIVQQYGGSSDENWERFLTDLENLPDEFKVLGINDYLFLDGYERILTEKSRGRLDNIELILPVIELRLDKFAGTTGSLSKVNLHVIFSDKIPPRVIKEQFMAGLSRHYHISPQYANRQIEWEAIPTRESVEDLGARIIASVPEEEQNRFYSPMKEGFNNLCVSLDSVMECLSNSYLKDNHITAVGKTEWADINWDDHSIAEKKNVINSVDFVFVSSENVTNFQRAKQHLTEQMVNNHLIDCSDAHHYSGSDQKDRIGKCFTWIKADPTFEGLKQAHREPDRIYVGDRPGKLRHVNNHRSQYIRSLQIGKTEDADLDEIWFDNSLEFNPGLVAIIGNKGNGKSALTDIIALLGQSHSEKFSFLCPSRFRDRRDNKAQHFESTIEWESEDTHTMGLNEIVPTNTAEKVRYIPQNFFEILCNEIQVGEGSKFTSELKKVILSHIQESERLGYDNLDDLAEQRTLATQQRIRTLRQRLERLNVQIADFEGQTTEGFRERLRGQIEAKTTELQAHNNNQPDPVPEPSTDTESNQLIKQYREDIRSLNEQSASLTEQQNRLARLRSDLKVLSGQIGNFEDEYQHLLEEYAPLAERLDINLGDVIDFSINLSPLTDKETQIENQLDETFSSLDETQTLIADKQDTIQELRQSLDEADRNYQRYLQDLEDWTARRDEIVGSASEIDSLRYFESLLHKSLEELPQAIEDRKAERNELMGEIYEKITEIRDSYAELYEPVQEAIADSEIIEDEYDFSFATVINSVQFVDRFLNMISQRVRGPFQGRSEGERNLRELLSGFDFESNTDALNFPERILQCMSTGSLLEDGGQEGEADLDISNIDHQILSSISRAEFYDFLFGLEYLQPEYQLRLNGKNLRQLSPGERGALLLIFYLLVDKDNYPLVIDQPDENLDSESIFQLLVPCIKEAKKTRQIFIVTHNPNLAVVCDAEQIIHAQIDKADQYRVTYTTGAIENPDMNAKIIDVLEGTWPAFSNRDSKYFRPD